MLPPALDTNAAVFQPPAYDRLMAGGVSMFTPGGWLAARLFGNWIAYSGQGLGTVVEYLRVSLSVLKIEAVREEQEGAAVPNIGAWSQPSARRICCWCTCRMPGGSLPSSELAKYASAVNPSHGLTRIDTDHGLCRAENRP